MDVVDVGFAVGFLALLVAVGTIIHEFLHAIILRAFGIPYTIEWFTVSHMSSLQSWFTVKWATVTPGSLPADVSPWQLRLAALAPLSIAAPFVLVIAGVLPDPFAQGTLTLKLAAIALMASAIPSPDDFSLFWHAERVLSERDEITR